MAVRISRWTGCPARWNSSRTSWVFPSPTTTRHQELEPETVTFTSVTSFGTTRRPSMTTPRCSLRCASSSGTPRTLTVYSRKTP